LGVCPWGFKSPSSYYLFHDTMYHKRSNNYLVGHPMHESTLDLSSDDREMDIDKMFTHAIEEEAAKLEITVDYYLYEFM
jgi:hypothetical protein